MELREVLWMNRRDPNGPRHHRTPTNHIKNASRRGHGDKKKEIAIRKLRSARIVG